MNGQRPKVAANPSGIDVFNDIDQAALDAIPTGLCVCTVEGALVRYNCRAVELWGRALPLGDPNRQHGSGFRRYQADGAPLPFAATPVASVLRSGQPIIGAEVIIEQPDGSRVPVLMNVAPLKSKSGRLQGAVCSFQALTERKRIEEALRASEAELQSVINRTPFMLVRCSRDLHYRFVSQAYAQLVGVRREGIVGKTIAEAIGDKGFKTLQPHIEKVLRGETTEFDCEIDFPQIGPRRLHIAYRPETDAAGKVDGWIASLLDITEQSRAVQAREQLASIVESSGDAITGLGLSQVYGLAHRSGGTVQIASEIGRGTKVTIYLPRSEAPIAAPSPEDSTRYMAADPRTILVVEDNRDVKNVAVSLLEQLGYKTIAVESASEALDVLASGQAVNLLFTDVALPGQLDGLALARKVTDRYGTIPIVLTTGYTRAFDSDPEFPVLRKPYQISGLGRLIHQALYPQSAGTAH